LPAGSANAPSRFGVIIHPVISTLNDLVSNTADGLKTIAAGTDGITDIPLNIYFKYDVKNQTVGSTFDANTATRNPSPRVKVVRFFLEPENSARPFDFSIKFNLYNKRANLVNVVKNIIVSG
jgi:hypothetical protein